MIYVFDHCSLSPHQMLVGGLTHKEMHTQKKTETIAFSTYNTVCLYSLYQS